jgi:hypothetical protein
MELLFLLLAITSFNFILAQEPLINKTILESVGKLSPVKSFNTLK